MYGSTWFGRQLDNAQPHTAQPYIQCDLVPTLQLIVEQLSTIVEDNNLINNDQIP